MLIVTFTSIPPRFPHLGGLFDALAAQLDRPDRVEMYLPPSYRRFPGDRPALPPLPDWVEVIEVEEDLGPATKVLPAIERWRGKDVDLLYCDDDRAYDTGWVARMRAARARLPGVAICEHGMNIDAVGDFTRKKAPQPRAERNRLTEKDELESWASPDHVPSPEARQVFTREGHIDIMEGYRGVLVRPDTFHPDVFRRPDLIWTVDDIWLSGMATLQGTRIWATAPMLPPLVLGETDRISPLFQHREQGMGRHTLNWIAVTWFRETYGIWK